MGWNAGATGELVFPDRAALLAWRKSTARFDAWEDWEAVVGYPPEQELERGVADLLDFLRGYHHPESYGVLELREEGARLQVTMDLNEDAFREVQYELLWALRAAARFGAEGRAWLMGTAGAEGDFTCELTLAQGRSSLRSLQQPALGRFYAGPEYGAFTERITGLLERANPAFRAFMKRQRQGQAPAPAGGDLHSRAWAALQAQPDEALLRAVRAFPRLVPTGQGQAVPAKAWPSGEALRQALGEPKSEEVRGLVLWLLGQLDPGAARPLALEALDKPSSEWMAAAAVEALAPALDDDAVARIAAMLKSPPGLYPIWSAGTVLREAKLPSAGKALVELLGRKAPRGTGPQLFATVHQAAVSGLRHRQDTWAAPRLAAFALDKRRDPQARRAAAETLLAWGDREALAALRPLSHEEYGPADLGIRARFAVDAKGVFNAVAPRVRAKVRSAARDVPLHRALEYLAQEATEARKAKRQPLLERDPRWVDAALALLRLGDHYLTYNALALLAEVRGDDRVGPAVAALLANRKVQLAHVAEVLQRQADPATAEAIERRLQQGGLEGYVRASLQAALRATRKRRPARKAREPKSSRPRSPRA